MRNGYWLDIGWILPGVPHLHIMFWRIMYRRYSAYKPDKNDLAPEQKAAAMHL
jgi:hypothetical protein